MANYAQYGVEDPNKVKQRYQGYINDYTNQATTQANQQIAARQAAADKQQNQNYINYMMAQKAMPEQMARLGLTGGATESALLRQNLNYANTRYNTNAAAQGDINTINQNLTNNLNAYRLEQQKAMQTELATNENALYERQTAAKQQKFENDLATKKYNDTKADNAYTKMANRVDKYGTVKDATKHIKALDKKIKNLNAKLKKAKSAAEKAKIKAQIAAAKRERSYTKAHRSQLKGAKK